VTRRTYTGPIIDVSFDGALCQHAAECVRGMPTVFDTSAKPWINPEHADTAELGVDPRLGRGVEDGRHPADALGGVLAQCAIE